MRRLFSAFAAGLCLGITYPAAALPGQNTEVVTAWILGNPTLQAALGEDLIVQRTAGKQKFVFEASIFPPGRRSSVTARGSCSTPIHRGRIRSEQLTLADAVNSVPRDRLELGLRSIYGLELYLDYWHAGLVYTYPDDISLDQAQRRGQTGLAYKTGEIRIGEHYAYWLERAQLSDGTAPSGHIAVMLKEDVPKLVLELGGGEMTTLDCPRP